MISVILSQPTGVDKSCQASWTMPNFTILTNQTANQPQYNYQRVGLDGTSSQCNALLQGGTFAMYKSNTLSYGFWYEFYPTGPTLMGSPTLSPGDNVFVQVVATSITTGTVYVENTTTEKTRTINLTAPSGSKLCQTAVEWIEENPNTSKKAFLTFSNFFFNECYAEDSNGKVYDLTGSQGRTLSSSSAGQQCHPSNAQGSSVQIIYDGPTN
ncbi:hypothetical protein VHEMI10398 [[Torrubiella] hemipterigena]|uniref:Uncharacterized protein n=1 Tax=[Torrubiella] hemipterigena TaxID=1531966 RepID=A0A0A1TCW6_9HYPO|nr:hypothetical protein VHEMI10398 [[Torrubiella] hemipterigena]